MWAVGVSSYRDRITKTAPTSENVAQPFDKPPPTFPITATPASPPETQTTHKDNNKKHNPHHNGYNNGSSHNLLILIYTLVELVHGEHTRRRLTALDKAFLFGELYCLVVGAGTSVVRIGEVSCAVRIGTFLELFGLLSRAVIIADVTAQICQVRAAGTLTFHLRYQVQR